LGNGFPKCFPNIDVRLYADSSSMTLNWKNEGENMKGQKTITGFGAVSALALFVVGACGGSGAADIAGDADL
jgi:hypothetical protein